MDFIKVLMMGATSPHVRDFDQRLRQSGYRVESERTLERGVRRAASFLPDMVILDQGLPDGEFFEVCRRIRNAVPPGREPSYLVLSRVLLESASSPDGEHLASQHLKKLRFLLGCPPDATVADPQLRLSIEGLEMDVRRHEARMDGRTLDLTPIEFRLLWTFASDPGVVYNRQQLGQRCRDTRDQRRERTIDVHINGLRKKLGQRAKLIQTVRGLGYRLAARKGATR